MGNRDKELDEIVMGTGIFGLAVIGVALAIAVTHVLIASLLLGFVFYWAYHAHPKRWSRLLLVLAGSFLTSWYWIGPPMHTNEGELYWALGPVAVWMAQTMYKYYSAFPKMFTFIAPQSITPLYFNLSFYGSLMGGATVALLIHLRFRHQNPMGESIYKLASTVCFYLFYPIKWLQSKTYFEARWGYYLLATGCLVMAALLILELSIYSANFAGWSRAFSFYMAIAGLVAAYDCFYAVPVKVSKNAVPLGTDVRDGRSIALTLDQLNHHVHIIGESGFGKTNLLMNILKHHIHTGLGAVFVDLKADAEMVEQLFAECVTAKREQDFLLFSCDHPKESLSYNLCARGNATELKDKIIGAFEWKEPYYQKVSEEVLLTLCTVLVIVRDKYDCAFNLADIHRCLESPAAIQVLAAEIGNDDVFSKNALTALASKMVEPIFYRELQGLRANLGNLVKSEFGHLLTGKTNGIDLFEALQEQKIVYILLDSNKYDQTAISLGKMILQDLRAVSAHIMSKVASPERKYCSIIIDEFSDLATPQFASFLAKARGSKIGVIVAHQELAQLRKRSEELENEVVGNTATTISFLQQVASSVETIAAISGTYTTTKHTRQIENSLLFGKTSTGYGSEHEVESYLVHPNTIKNLRVGECVVICKYPASTQAKVLVDRYPMRQFPKAAVWQYLEQLSKEQPRTKSKVLSLERREQLMLTKPMKLNEQSHREEKPSVSSSYTKKLDDLY